MIMKALEAQDFIEAPYHHKKVYLEKDVWAQQIFQKYVIEHWGKSPTQLRIYKNVNIKNMDGTSATQFFNYAFTSAQGISYFKCELLDNGDVGDVEFWFKNVS